jgi:hypothetical protein
MVAATPPNAGVMSRERAWRTHSGLTGSYT